MRKIILFIASSLDGYIARRDHSIDWLFTSGDYGYKKFYDSIDTVIVGRKTYDVVRGFEKEPFKGKKIFVFSRSNPNFSKDPVKTVRRLKKEKGRNIWLVGGGKMISVLMNAGLVDEIINSVHPIVLGSGIPLFPGVKETNMKLKKTTAFPSGLLQLHYAVKTKVYKAECRK
jgi:dihydrofolate reductase